MASPVQDHVHAAVQVEHALGSLQGHVQPPLPAQLCCCRLHRGHAEGSSRLQADASPTCQLQPPKASQTLATCRTLAIAKPRSISHAHHRGDLVRWPVGAIQTSRRGLHTAKGCSAGQASIQAFERKRGTRKQERIRGLGRTGHSRARCRMSSRDPRAQNSVTMQGGAEQAPRNMTMLGWRSTLISCVSLRSSSSTLLLLADLQQQARSVKHAAAGGATTNRHTQAGPRIHTKLGMVTICMPSHSTSPAYCCSGCSESSVLLELRGQACSDRKRRHMCARQRHSKLCILPDTL